MSRVILDPGKNAQTAEQAKQLRLKEWKRPKDEKKIKELRADRVKAAKEVMGYGDSVSDERAV